VSGTVVELDNTAPDEDAALKKLSA